WNPTTHAWDARVTLFTSERALVVPQAAIDATGQAFVAWGQEPESSSAFWPAWASRFSPESRTWSVAAHVGVGQSRASGFQLFITDAGNLLAFWSGRMNGVLWEASTGTWNSMASDGEWLSASLCELGGEDLML